MVVHLVFNFGKAILWISFVFSILVLVVALVVVVVLLVLVLLVVAARVWGRLCDTAPP